MEEVSFCLDAGPRGAVAIQVAAREAGSTWVKLVNNDGLEVMSFLCQDIREVSVQDERKITWTTESNDLQVVSLSFCDSAELKSFLKFMVLQNPDGAEAIERSDSIHAVELLRSESGISTLDALADIYVSDDSSDENGDHSSDGGNDEENDKNHDMCSAESCGSIAIDAEREQAPHLDHGEVNWSHKHMQRGQIATSRSDPSLTKRRNRSTPIAQIPLQSLKARKQSMKLSLSGTEWVMFDITRFTFVGQAEPCSVLVSTHRRALQFVSILTGETLAVYENEQLKEIIQHGVKAVGLTLKAVTIDGPSSPSGTLGVANTSPRGKTEQAPMLKKKTGRLNKVKAKTIGRRLEAVAQDQSRKTVSKLFKTKSRNKGLTPQKPKGPRQVCENFVFESHEELTRFLHTVEHASIDSISVRVRSLENPEHCLQEMRGRWCIFTGYFANYAKPRTLAVNPNLGCILLYKTKAVRFGIVQPLQTPKLSLRFVTPESLQAFFNPKAKGMLTLQFRATHIDPHRIGVPDQGSFDPFTSGVLLKERLSGQTLWCFPGALPPTGADADSVSKGYKLTIDLRSRTEAQQLQSCLHSLRLVAVNAEQDKRHSASSHQRRSFSKLKSLTASGLKQRNGHKGPTVTTQTAANLQRHVWSQPGHRWFEVESRIFIGTFNVGDASPPSSAAMAHWIPSPADQIPSGIHLRKKHTTVCSTGANGMYSIYALGLQEVSTKFDEWTKAFSNHLGAGYTLLISVKLWEIGLLLYVKDEELQHINSVVSGSEKTGMRIAKSVLGVQLGNKGGVGVGFRWHDVPLAFINAHLAAQQNKVTERNMNFQQIMAKINLEGTPSRIDGQYLEPTIGFEHVFFLGDLNYRVNLEYAVAAQAVKESNWSLLHEHDQLVHEIQKGRTFYRFRTEQPNFAPTYRWKKGRRELSNKREQPPSYTDRVLWHSRPGLQDSILLESYGCANNLMVSDHRPVAATFRFKIREFYGWPSHPLAVIDKHKIPRPMKEDCWCSPRGDFFLSEREASTQGSPYIRLINVAVKLYARSGGQHRPSFLRLQVDSPILQQPFQSTFSPGEERVHGKESKSRKPEKKYVFERGYGAQVEADTSFHFDNYIGFPKLSPTMWDPTYLRSQFLILNAHGPRNNRVEESLVSHHIGLHEGENTSAGLLDILQETESLNMKPFSGQSCVALCHVVDAVCQQVASSGFSNWTRKNTPLIPFSEPLVSGSQEIGKVTGEICLVPADGDRASRNLSAAQQLEQLEQGRADMHCVGGTAIVASGWAQLAFNKNSRKSKSRSARVFVVLDRTGHLKIYSDCVLDERRNFSAANLVTVLDMRECNVEKASKTKVCLKHCRRVIDRKDVDATFVFDAHDIKAFWMSSLLKASNQPRPEASDIVDTWFNPMDDNSDDDNWTFVAVDLLPPPPSMHPPLRRVSKKEILTKAKSFVEKPLLAASSKSSNSPPPLPPPPPPSPSHSSELTTGVQTNGDGEGSGGKNRNNHSTNLAVRPSRRSFVAVSQSSTNKVIGPRISFKASFADTPVVYEQVKLTTRVPSRNGSAGLAAVAEEEEMESINQE